MNPNSSEGLALSGVKVLALEVSVSGPHCTRILGDMGAEVIKIERPKDGDLIRHWDSAVRGLSSGYVWLNYNKRSLALDIKKPAGLEILQRLMKTVDIVVENFTPGAAKRLGLGYEDLRAINPGLIYCSISGYGQGGPYMQVKAYDLLIQGEAGIIATTGSKDEPAKVSVPIADLACSMYAVTGILTALYQRTKTGRGQYIDISMFESILAWQGYFLQHYWHQGEEPPESRRPASLCNSLRAISRGRRSLRKLRRLDAPRLGGILPRGHSASRFPRRSALPDHRITPQKPRGP